MAETIEELVAGVGVVLTNLRHELGISQKEMAKRIGTTQAQVHYLESGKKNDLKLSTLLKFTNALDLELWIHIMEPNQENGAGCTTSISDAHWVSIVDTDMQLSLEWPEPSESPSDFLPESANTSTVRS